VKNFDYYFDGRRYRELSEDEAEEAAVLPAPAPGTKTGLEARAGLEDMAEGEVGQVLPATTGRNRGYRELAVDGSSRLELPLQPSEGDCVSAGAIRRHLVTKGEAIPQLDGGENQRDEGDDGRSDWAAEVEGARDGEGGNDGEDGNSSSSGGDETGGEK
jgi:hypothetical protein